MEENNNDLMTDEALDNVNEDDPELDESFLEDTDDSRPVLGQKKGFLPSLKDKNRFIETLLAIPRIIKLAILGVIILLIALLVWYASSDSSTEKGKTGSVSNNNSQLITDKDGQSVSSGEKGEKAEKDETELSDSKRLFKKSIANAVDGQAGKYEVSKEWKKATVDYSQTGDKKAFQDRLIAINETRAELYKLITNDGELNELVKRSLNNQKDYLTKAYNAKRPSEAVDAYNDWNDSDLKLDNEYLKLLTELLDSVGIEYSVKETENGRVVNY